MANDFFRFKEFIVNQGRSAMKVTTDGCLFGAWIRSSQQGAISVLDLGAGTGLLSLLFAQNHSSAIIEAIEIDENAFQQCLENFRQSPWPDRLKAIHADVKTFPFSKKYDVLLSNPPFYEKEIRAENNARNIAHHHDGLLLSDLMDVIKENLEPSGKFFLLLPFKRSEEIKRLFLAHSFHIERTVFVRQTINHPYFRIMVKGRLNNDIEGETEIEEITIKDASEEYSPQFVSLLRQFYLYL